MATKKEKTKVTRISASDAPAVKKTTKKSSAKPVKAVTTPRAPRQYGILSKLGGYFKGAWEELRQVRWPTRRATWGLTGAVLLFTAFFVAFITALDAGFKLLFEQILQ